MTHIVCVTPKSDSLLLATRNYRQSQEDNIVEFVTKTDWEQLLMGCKTEGQIKNLIKAFLQDCPYQADFGFAHSVLDDYNFSDKIILSCLKTDEVLKDIENQISMFKPAEDPLDHYIRSVNMDNILEGVLMTTRFLRGMMMIPKEIRGDV